MEYTTTEPIGTDVYGSSDTFTSDYFTSATTGYDYSTGYDVTDLTTATGSTDIFEPLLSTFGSF
jgi:hypothetical protein